MKKVYVVRMASMQMILSAMIILACVGCISVKLVSDYDENIDKGVTEIQKKTEAFLLSLKPYAPESTQFYDGVRVEISSLRLRADSLQRNSLTVQMLDKLANNIDRLEQDHKSKEGIKQAEIPLYRGGLNSQFTSILTFELAKKRGENPDEKKALSPPTTQANK